MKTVQDFFDKVGRKEFEEYTGAKQQVISRAITENVMPSHWFIDARDMAEKNGLEINENLFR